MANVKLEITIPDAHVARVLKAFEALAGIQLELEAHDMEYSGHWSYKYQPKQTGENNKDFVTRAIKQNIRALVRMYDYSQDQERYGSAVAQIPMAEQDVPDDIIE